VNLTGDADPKRNEEQQSAAHQSVAASRSEADRATTGNFGENDIYPTVPQETLRPSYKPSGIADGRASGGKVAPAIPEQARADFDRNATPSLSDKVSQKLQRHRLEQEKYQKDSNQIREEGQRKIGEETAGTRAEQVGTQQQVVGEVSAGRKRWLEENRKIHGEVFTQSAAKRAQVDLQIQEKVRSSQEKADTELTNAEARAEDERVKTEAKAAAKKQEAENQPRSFWERVKGAVSEAFDAIKKAINHIFDELRKVVKEIIEKAKAVVRGIIEEARQAVVGFISAFGTALKGLVSIALSAFPETAAKARAWIDGKVHSAVATVNAAAEALKKATDAILNWVGATLDKTLSILQSAVLLLLDGLRTLAQGLVDGLELLTKLIGFIARIGPIIKRITDLINDPTPVFEQIKLFIAPLIDQVSGQVYTIAERAITFSPPPKNHWEGIKAKLLPKLDYLKSNWWQVIKNTAWTLIWPFAKDESGERPLFKDAREFWKLLGEIYTSIGAGHYSKAIDQVLRLVQLGNSIVGIFYGWIFIGLVVGGGILGAEAGVVPGLIAGGALALEIGQGLLIAAAATEGAILAKSGYNLIFQHQTPEENDEDYERIAGSSLTLGIMGALVLLGVIAARFGKAILAGAGRAVGAVVRVVLGARAAAALEAAVARIRAQIGAFIERLQNEGRFKFKGSGVDGASYEGPAVRLHPERFDAIISDLERNGVKINVRQGGKPPWEASYGPGESGKPGTISVDKDVDLRTLEHEYKHFLDDKAKNYPGLRYYIENPDEMYRMEAAAYDREIELVNADTSLTPEEKANIVKQLEALKDADRVRLLGSRG
jgi:hypothetical protein